MIDSNSSPEPLTESGHGLEDFGSEFDSELVLVCHCPPPKHTQIYYVVDGEFKTPVGEEVQYVDESCPENAWDKIEDNSKSYIWGIYCPIYLLFKFEGNSGLTTRNISSIAFIDILKNSWRILKPSGIVVFMIPESLVAKMENLVEKVKIIEEYTQTDTELLGNWEMSIKHVSEVPFTLGYHGRSNSDYLFVCTKISSGGKKEKRKKMKTRVYRRKNKSKKRKTKKRNSKCKF
jgi:hypothetical protein